MAKKKTEESKAAKERKRKPLKYKQMVVEIVYTDGEITTATVNSLVDCCWYIEQRASEHYVDSIRIELF